MIPSLASPCACCGWLWLFAAPEVLAVAALLAPLYLVAALYLHAGAPLVGRALQRLGALDSSVEVAGLTPASFSHAKLAPDAKFGTPVSIR